MRKIFAAIAMCVFAVVANSAVAAEHGSADEATAMVKKAVAFVEANGKEKAFAEFDKQSGPFKDRNLYIFIVDLKGKTLAHGGNPKLVGKDVTELKDADGKYFIKNMIDVAEKKGKGWVDYQWVDPATKSIEPKSTYVEKYEDFFVGCGIYKK